MEQALEDRTTHETTSPRDLTVLSLEYDPEFVSKRAKAYLQTLSYTKLEEEAGLARLMIEHESGEHFIRFPYPNEKELHPRIQANIYLKLIEEAQMRLLRQEPSKEN